MRRRQFLNRLALFGTASLVAVGQHGWAVSNPALATSPNRLVVVFLRGGIDGLNVLIPYQEAGYYTARPTLAIAPPGSPNGAIDLDGFYGLHPALKDLQPFWQRGQLAFVQAAGSPDPTRSHFEAQAYMETGSPGDKSTTTGWMNRLLTQLSLPEPTQSVSVGRAMPRSLVGPEMSASLTVNQDGFQPLPVDRSAIQTAFDGLYQGSDPVQQAYQTGRVARDRMLTTLSEVTPLASASGFRNSAHHLAQLMTGDTQTQIAFMELGGWDTHVDQAQSFDRLLPQLAGGLSTLAQGLGPTFEHTTIVVMSEFCRTVEENGNQGTDHGRGNLIWVLGGPVRGQKVYGDWPGLAPEDRYAGRDLAVTTDFRDVVASLLTPHWGLSNDQLSDVFPNYGVQRTLPMLVS